MKGVNELNRRGPDNDPDNEGRTLMAIASGGALGKKIQKIYSKINNLKNYPKGFRRERIEKEPIKNRSLEKQLRNEFGGEWHKYYEKGYDRNGTFYEIHYFKNDKGMYYEPKITGKGSITRLREPIHLK